MNVHHIHDRESRGTRVVFRLHAVQRMYERAISAATVLDVLASGTNIEEYPEDEPYPSRLVLGWCESRPIHVVVADNRPGNEMIVITVYEPGEEQWDDGFGRRFR